MYLTGGEPLDIMGVGDICLKMSNSLGERVVKLMHNIISVGQLDDEGHNVTFTSSAWNFMKSAMVVVRGNKTGTLYMTSSCRDMIFVVNNNAN